MPINVRALLVSQDDPSSVWVGELTRGRHASLLAFAGGKVYTSDNIIPGLLLELREKTNLPAVAFDLPILIRPVARERKQDPLYCFLVWLAPGHVPQDTERMINWRQRKPKQLLANAQFAGFCKGLLLDWLERDDGPFAQAKILHNLAKMPLAIEAASAPPRTKPSNYPEPFFSRMLKREKRPLGDVFGLKNFGVNLTTLKTGGESALLHRHSKQDEFIFIVEGAPTLVTDVGEVKLRPGMCAGFPAEGVAHQLVNRTGSDVVYLEVGDRTPGDEGTYPEDDLEASLGPDGKWIFTHKDGSPYG